MQGSTIKTVIVVFHIPLNHRGIVLPFSDMRMYIHLRELKILLNTAPPFKPSQCRAVEIIVIFWSDFLEKMLEFNSLKLFCREYFTVKFTLSKHYFTFNEKVLQYITSG
jgi:hypothetical protein